MRKKSTRLLSAALAACMMLSVLPVGAFAAEPGAAEPENGVSAQADPVDSEFVEINDTNFPDPVFLQYVKDNIDTADTTSGQKDGRLSKAERDAVTEISITNTDCTDLTGIAYFANLTTLECQHNGLKELNLEYNKNLTDLNCSYNQLTTLDVSKNAKLSALRCYNNGMVELNLGDITQLTVLQCEDNNLTELDVSKNPYLKELQCGENKLRRVVIGKKYSLTGLYLRGNQLTSLDLSGITGKILNLDDIWQRYAIDVNEDGTFDLSSLPEGFDVDKTSGWVDGTPNKNILKVYSHRVRYLYNTGSTYTYNHQNRMTVILVVNQHKYQWQHNDTEHWRRCELSDCPGLTAEQVAKTTHDYADAKDNDCNTCGYVRPLYTVTTVNATAKLEDKVLDAPVAAGTEVILTAGNAPEGKTFAGWKLYNVSDTESEITDETELANLLKNGTETTATLTMPAYNVKAEPYYSNIPYNIKAENCTVDKTEAAKGDTVTATRRALKANERFTGWTVKVNGVEQDTDTFLKPDANDPAKVRFTMPAENVEIKANFEGNPTLNIGDHVTANIDGSDASVPSGSAVPVGETVHLTAIAPEGQHFTGWTVKVGGEEQKADTFLTTPDENDPTKVTFTMPDANVEVAATFADDPIGPDGPDPVGPSDTGNIQGAISAVVIGAAAGAIIYEAGTGIYRVINMPGIPMPSNRIELAELLWEHAGKPEPVSTALYSDIDEGDTDAQKAARWAVEQDLMKDDADNNKFHPAFPVSKLRTCLTWNAAKEKGLFDKTEE